MDEDGRVRDMVGEMEGVLHDYYLLEIPYVLGFLWAYGLAGFMEVG